MAVIENAAASPAALNAWRKSMQTMDRSELMAQQMVQRGAEHALQELQRLGVTPDNCAAMLVSLREGLMLIHEVAAARGIVLMGYQDPDATQAAPASEQAGAAFPMTGDEHESALGEWQSGSAKPTRDGTYLREFDEGAGTSEYHRGKWLRDGFFPSDIQDARWRGRAAPASGGVAPELHSGTADLVRRFSDALAAKLAAAEKKYGYSDGWKSNDWMDECRAMLIYHLDKGDPRDVAAYCAFLWHHGESTATPATERDARQVGLIAAADYIDGLAAGYAAEHSYTEPDTGAVVFDRRDAGLEYHSTLVELADDLRGMAARVQAKDGGA